MKIHKIRIENYKSIGDVTFDLNDTTSVIVGPNDHGKTNILNAIHDIFSFSFQEGTNKLHDSSFYKKKKRRDSGASPLRISFQIKELPNGLRYTKKRLSSIALSIQFMADGTFRCSFNNLELTKPKRTHSQKAFEKYREIRSHLNVIYVPTFRNLEAHLNEYTDEAALYSLISTQLLSMMETQQGGTTAAYRTVNSIYEKISTLVDRSFRDIEKQVSTYLPSSSKLKIDFGFLNKTDDPDRALSKIIAKEVFVKNKSDGTKITDLGSGIQQAVLIGLLEKNLIRQNKTNILLFEEPESFLHPSAQRELFLKLSNLTKRPSTQGIFSTHSAAIVDSANLSSLIVIKKDLEFGITDVFPFSPPDAGVFNQKEFARLELEKTFQNSEIFFSELVVFVEGRSDQLVLREAIRKKFPELAYKITIVDVGGSGSVDLFINFISSFRNRDGYAFKWISMLDKDSLKGTKATHNACKKIKLSEPINWTKVDSLADKEISLNGQSVNRNIARLTIKQINKNLSANNFYINVADIEYLLIDENNFRKIRDNLIQHFDEDKNDLLNLNSADDLARLLGSKGPNLDWEIAGTLKRKWKKPYIAKTIISNLDNNDFTVELNDIVDLLKKKL